MMSIVCTNVLDFLNGIWWLWLFAMVQFLAYGILVGMKVKTKRRPNTFYSQTQNIMDRHNIKFVDKQSV
ncbi:hypothetical protein ACT3CD_11015 [Geofilum sp. OHC36d9]|uniref:hypothetical protein n=1 Tax=Geofilum sp. OHC36d9 TaxID=3458413 RepID=UPI004034EE0A